MRDKMREEFEECFLAEQVAGLMCKANFEQEMAETIVKLVAFERREDGEYKAVVPRERFKGWLQSRAALVVELPPTISHCNRLESGFVMPEAASYDEAIEDCREAITKAGVTVK